MKTFIILILSTLSLAHAAKDILLIEGTSLFPDSKVDALLDVTKITQKIPDYEIKYISFPEDRASAKQAQSELNREFRTANFDFAIMSFLKFVSLPEARKKYEVVAEFNPGECSSGILFLTLPGASPGTGSVSGKKIGTFPTEKLLPVMGEFIENLGKKNELKFMLPDNEFVAALKKKEIDYIINPVSRTRAKGYSSHPFSKLIERKELAISHYQPTDIPCSVLIAKTGQRKNSAQRASLIKTLGGAKPDWKIKPVSDSRLKRINDLAEKK